MKRAVKVVALLAVAAVVLAFGVHHLLKAAFPLKYEETVTATADECGLTPSLLMAVIHTESGFQPDARSHAGAVGLMQITEPTLQWAMMRTGGDVTLTAEALLEPDFNIRTGGQILRLLGEQFESPDTVLAAYNAGAGQVASWLSDPRYSADGVTLTAIPFEETAAYVKKVRRAQSMYQKLYGLP